MDEIKETYRKSDYYSSEEDIPDDERSLLMINSRREAQSRFLLDELVSQLKFSRYHFSIYLICTCCAMTHGFMIVHFHFSRRLYYQEFFWVPSSVNFLMILFWVFKAIGNTASTTISSLDWNSSSNGMISLIGAVSILMIFLYDEPGIYSITLVIFAFCSGVIENNSYIYFFDMFSLTSRRNMYLSLGVATIFGMAYCTAWTWIMHLGLGLNSPSYSILGLFFIWISMPFLTYWTVESPRMLFYCNEPCELVDLYVKVNGLNRNVYLHSKVEQRLENLIEFYRKHYLRYYNMKMPKYEWHFSLYDYLFEKFQVKRTFGSILLVVFNSFSIFMIGACAEHIAIKLKNSNFNLFR